MHICGCAVHFLPFIHYSAQFHRPATEKMSGRTNEGTAGGRGCYMDTRDLVSVSTNRAMFTIAIVHFKSKVEESNKTNHTNKEERSAK